MTTCEWPSARITGARGDAPTRTVQLVAYKPIQYLQGCYLSATSCGSRLTRLEHWTVTAIVLYSGLN